MKIRPQQIPNLLTKAHEHFTAGNFSEASSLCSIILETDQANTQALLLQGKLALYSNNFATAEKLLLKAAEQTKPSIQLLKLICELLVRQDRFAEVKPFYEKLGDTQEIERLRSFENQEPYALSEKKKRTEVPFIRTDPLPLVALRIDNKQAIFLVDTGAAETIIDSAFAAELGLELFGTKIGTFAGGGKASIQSSRINTMKIGEFSINNLPVKILPMKHINQIFGGEFQIGGVIGTKLFYHFITTLDYPQAKLVLQQKFEDIEIETEKQLKPCFKIPFWLAGDHFIVTQGRINESRPMLFFVDTGLAGGGFTGPESTLKSAKIVIDQNKARAGISGAGKVKTIPYNINNLSLGPITRNNVTGIHTEKFPLEFALGFRIGGIISHQFFRPFSLTFDFEKMLLYIRGNDQ